jgi:hypothetical protein
MDGVSEVVKRALLEMEKGLSLIFSKRKNAESK